MGTIWRVLSKPFHKRQGHDTHPLWLKVGTPVGPKLASRLSEQNLPWWITSLCTRMFGIFLLLCYDFGICAFDTGLSRVSSLSLSRYWVRSPPLPLKHTSSVIVFEWNWFAKPNLDVLALEYEVTFLMIFYVFIQTAECCIHPPFSRCAAFQVLIFKKILILLGNRVSFQTEKYTSLLRERFFNASNIIRALARLTPTVGCVRLTFFPLVVQLHVYGYQLHSEK